MTKQPRNAQERFNASKPLDDPRYRQFVEDEFASFLDTVNVRDQGDADRSTTSRLLKRFLGEQVDPHGEIAFKVFRRLRLRHLQLLAAEKEALSYEVHDACKDAYEREMWRESSSDQQQPYRLDPGKPGSPSVSSVPAPPPEEGLDTEGESAHGADPRYHPPVPGLRAYHLAVTDVFVEKAIAYLEDHAKPYRRNGFWYSLAAILLAFVGTVLALLALSSPSLIGLSESAPSGVWDFAYTFSRSFTAFGMLVLVVALLWRHGKANLDQAERLMERRHALRQGRLFVHLNDGRLDIDQLDKAFNWNYTQANAFANIKDDPQAPWGALGKQLMASAADLIHAGIRAAAKNPTDSEKRSEKE